MPIDNKYDFPADQVIVRATGDCFGQAQLPTFILTILVAGHRVTTVPITTNVLAVVREACEKETQSVVKLLIELGDGHKAIKRFVFSTSTTLQEE